MSDEILRCECNLLHAETVERVAGLLPPDRELYPLSELFKVFGDVTRVKILSALTHSEMCVCDLSALINMSKSAVSHQLRILKQSRLVKYRRDGKNVYYSLDDDHVRGIIEAGLTHIRE